MNPDKKSWLSLVVLVGALGYFVDIYDLILFTVVRAKSLSELGVPEASVLATGISVLNYQMAGMLLGGVVWGILGDRRGRISVLFGSILLYSTANILNGFVHDVPTYAWLRFIAGLGLAGELGAAVTLVSESLSKEHRGMGTTLVAAVGVSGAIAANLVAKAFDWRTAYFVGGGLGLLLLVLRVSTFESGLFEASRRRLDVRRGDWSLLLGSWERAGRYLRCILIGLPTWFVIGILVNLSPELAKSRGLSGVDGGNAIMWAYAGLVAGDLSSGLLSQLLRSRRKVVMAFVAASAVLTWMNLSLGSTPAMVYILGFASGFGVGYWAMFVTIGAEQFGTNLRATVAITVPNWARGALIPISAVFLRLKAGGFSPSDAALAVGLGCALLAFTAAWGLRETFGIELDYLEQP
jgi:putative MFS transporter